MKKMTINDLIKWKQEGRKFATSTAYDASFAQLFESQEMPVLLVGDSLGMVLQGHNDTLPVTVDDIAYHTRCVRAGSPNCLLMADMPFMSYTTPEQACENAAKLMRAGANMVKIEGGDWLVDTVKMLTERSVPVCAHLGLTPQAVNIFGGYKIQGRDQEKADRMVKDALALQEAGAQIVLLECVPAELAERITQVLDVPVIGIGAGNVTDGQILVMHDMFGISANYMPKFSKNFLAETGDMRKAVTKYIEDVANGVFPDDAHTIA
ncbi:MULTISPECIES: 3-methyl-2-oxobutanoate hydroxymethyltransferase [Vibrio]|jgi:3-methyl-2-oxobutanoate hydroxymethyltransferase|uniref:3-methyl-2-oxobutanoate hydroxymethyltransferase n=2 Tax=Vibrio alginolyticus TaxID=663 RepID=A0A7Y4EYF9_VIBAL|nr:MULTISPECIES: 3-methyl-2-oxobutanoate hydroxymethyltransferase [Vibrio]EEZ82711.1 3-methyl-2-oxobutanoate hydroxymethyltransferase [Vibrio alginolyticus 40B]MDW1807729.1 3-methyl-2-oxobutanoate hydroxymethyltransferase [Vibrio sp. Vb2362]MDW1970217.1 3-methyl-2-oxobutanoate hydroxymethyltransferase [Vibrio sp. 945]MDW2258320.1 3-methyl-2-oxobutanoate hydroxymethyltransferase [Vibrio sp. 1409]MDW2295088.1 3-methyl-2-oxobutanoate hydroxymethyltransferase [Vibrio sp. 1404]GAJ70848.1 3-methyl-